MWGRDSLWNALDSGFAAARKMGCTFQDSGIENVAASVRLLQKQRVAATDPALDSLEDAFFRLGVTAERPSLDLATTDPAGYLRGLSTATEAGELTSSPGLGDFVWVVSVVGDVPTTCLTS